MISSDKVQMINHSVQAFRDVYGINQNGSEKEQSWKNRMKLKSDFFARKFHQYNQRKDEEAEAIRLEWEAQKQIDGETSYFNVCSLVAEQLHPAVLGPLAYVFAYAGVGHFLTVVGCKHWNIVMNKYRVFFLACFGIWTEEVVLAYDLLKTATMVSPRNSLSDTMPQLLSVLIGSRAILFQIIPIGAVLSIAFASFASCPLFIQSSQLNDIMPELIITNAMNIAIKREVEDSSSPWSPRLSQEELVSSYYWRVYTRAVMIFWTESRLFQFVFSLLILLLSMLLLTYSQEIMRLLQWLQANIKSQLTVNAMSSVQSHTELDDAGDAVKDEVDSQLGMVWLDRLRVNKVFKDPNSFEPNINII
eukprot:gene10890-14616_t